MPIIGIGLVGLVLFWGMGTFIVHHIVALLIIATIATVLFWGRHEIHYLYCMHRTRKEERQALWAEQVRQAEIARAAENLRRNTIEELDRRMKE